jgi:hypothetical protein
MFRDLLQKKIKKRPTHKKLSSVKVVSVYLHSTWQMFSTLWALETLPKAAMKKSSSFCADLLQGPAPGQGNWRPGNAEREEDLYFEMEFPVSAGAHQSSSRLSVESYGSRSTLDSR